MEQFEIEIRGKLKEHAIVDLFFPPHFKFKAKGRRGVHELEVAEIFNEDKIIKIDRGNMGRVLIHLKFSEKYCTTCVVFFGIEKITVITAYRQPLKRITG